MVLSVSRSDQLTKFVGEAFITEVALVVSNPFLQAEMRLYNEFRHGRSPWSICRSAVRSFSCSARGHPSLLRHVRSFDHFTPVFLFLANEGFRILRLSAGDTQREFVEL